MSFAPGEEVICVDNGPGRLAGDPCPLIKGKTYIVLEACDCPCGHVMVERDRCFWMPDRFRRPIREIERLVNGDLAHV